MQMLQLFDKEGCMPDSTRVDMNVLADRMEDLTLPVELFNQMIMSDCMFVVKSENFIID